MAPKKDSAITIPRLLDCFKSTGKYPCPNDLLGFYKMASSENMMKFLKHKNAFEKSWDSDVDAIIPMKETKDAKGKVKKNKLSPQELEEKVDEFLKTKLDITLFPIVFKRLISYYLKGTTILDEKQYKMLEDIYKKFTEPKDRMKKVNAIIDKLPQNSIIILGHLIYLGKLFLETNENFKASNSHEEVERRFFNVPALIIYNEMADNDDKKKKKKKDDKLMMAVSAQMMEYITKDGFMSKEGDAKKLKQLFPKQSMKDENGKPLYSPVDLTSISNQVLTKDTDKKNIAAALFFGSVFKKLTTQYYSGNSIINDIQYCQLEKLDQKFTDPDPKAKAMLEFLNKKLPEKSICLLAHLLYLGKIFIETNDAFKNCDDHDSAVKAFFAKFGMYIYQMSTEELNKRQEEAKKLKKKNPTNKVFSPSSNPTLIQLVFDIWRDELKFIPKLSSEGRENYNQKFTVLKVLKSLKEAGKYNCPTDLEGFYTMATSDIMMEHITKDGAFRKPSPLIEIKKVIKPKINSSKVTENIYSPVELKDFVDQYEATKPHLHTLYANVFKVVVMHSVTGVSVLDTNKYSELEKLYKKFKERKARMDAVIDFIDNLSEKSICIIAHLIFLSNIYMTTSINFKTDSDQLGGFEACLTVGPALSIYNKQFYTPSHDDNQNITLGKLVLDCWKRGLDFTPNLTTEQKKKYQSL